MRRLHLVLLVALVATVLAAPTAGAARSAYQIDQDALAQKIAQLETAGVETLSGELAGAAWIAQVPDDWNGELVVWAHGYRGEGPALTVSEPAAHEWLLDNGYAWAASSYRRNSYDPGIGVIDSQLLTQHVQSQIGRADRTYLAGVSMGGHVTGAAIERFPGQWDGALPACGVLGDVELFDYFLDYNLGAAAFAGLEAADLTHPDSNWVDDEVTAIKAALSPLPPQLWAFGLTPAGQDFKDFVEVGSGGERSPFFDVGWAYWHSVDPDFFFDLGEGDGTIAGRTGLVAQNSDTVYAEEYAGVDGGIDDVVLRVEAANRVRLAQGQKPAPIIHGTPPVPVLAMHTLGDLFVPIEMLQLYADEVDANGLSDRLVTRAVRDVGHCTFTDGEWATAYADLFEWVATGDRPAGEDVRQLTQLSGCAFTERYDLPTPFFRGPFDFCPGGA